jgi:hypothetical protein
MRKRSGMNSYNQNKKNSVNQEYAPATLDSFDLSAKIQCSHTLNLVIISILKKLSMQRATLDIPHGTTQTSKVRPKYAVVTVPALQRDIYV